MSQITTLVKTHNLTDAVDFVTGGRIHLLVTQKEIEEARADYIAAKGAGVDVSTSEWLSQEVVKEVGFVFICPSDFPMVLLE